MLRYIHIQGKEAPSFYFRDKTAQHFKSLIQSLGDGSSLVISSMYRTDVLYTADKELSKDIFKLWALQEENFDESRLKVRTGRNEVLELFFTSLVSFSSVYKWYDIYLNEFRHACSLDQNNPILKDLKLCEQYLQESHRTLTRPIADANAHDLLPRKEVFQDLVKHINDFMN